MQKLVCPFAFFIVLIFSANLHAQEKKDDIRIVIDVSGSMKNTDPSNLRVSALKLLNGLIPDGAKAGVWTFGRYVNMTVKWGTVNDSWRKRADIGAEEIHSNALFTNIESALKRATTGWEKADTTTRRNLVLLTDGQVDISKDKAKNEKSRQQILDDSTKTLRENGVHVHAIALSKNADEILLKRLALETSGSFEIAESATDLQKIFFRMFERAVQPDTIELKDDQFTVDAKIKEITLLVFRQKDGQSTRLFPPEQSAISYRRPGNSIWRSDKGYDLVTIKNPREGLWTIEADMDPDNRVMVVTDLKLDVSGIPTHLSPAQSILVSAALFNQENQIRKNSFLRFVEFRMDYTDADGVKSNLALKHSGDRKLKGQYQYDFGEGLAEGRHRFLVTADSRTFNRSKHLDILVQWPAKVDIETAGEPGHYQLSISAREEYLKPDSLKVKVMLEAPDKSSQPLSLENNAGLWQTKITTGQDGMYRAMIEIEAESQAGEKVEYDLGGFSMIGIYREPAVNESVQSADSASEADNQDTDQLDLEDAAAQIQDNGPDWVVTSITIGIANLVLVLIGVGVMLFMRRKTIPPEISLE